MRKYLMFQTSWLSCQPETICLSLISKNKTSYAQRNISIGCPAPVKAAIHPPYSFTGSWLESTQVHNNKKYKDHLVPSACVALELRRMDSEHTTAHIDLYIFWALWPIDTTSTHKRYGLLISFIMWNYPVTLILLSTWVGRGVHTETLRYLATPTFKSYGRLITFFLIM